MRKKLKNIKLSSKSMNKETQIKIKKIEKINKKITEMTLDVRILVDEVLRSIEK